MEKGNSTPTVKGNSLMSFAFISSLVGGLIMIAGNIWAIIRKLYYNGFVNPDIRSIVAVVFCIFGMICIFNIYKSKKGAYSLVAFSVVNLALALLEMRDIIDDIYYGLLLRSVPKLLIIIAFVALVVTLLTGFRKNDLTIAKYVSIACVVLRVYVIFSSIISLINYYKSSSIIDSSFGFSMSVSPSIILLIIAVGAALFSLAILLIILSIMKEDDRANSIAERK